MIEAGAVGSCDQQLTTMGAENQTGFLREQHVLLVCLSSLHLACCVCYGFYFCFIETGSHYVALDVLKFTIEIHLPQLKLCTTMSGYEWLFYVCDLGMH